MFCEKCGRPTEDGQTICSSCAAEQSAVPYQETAEPVAEQTSVLYQEPVAEAPVADTFELNTADTAPAQKAPKKKKGLIAGIVALAIAAAAAIGIFLNLDSINGFVGRTFQSPEDYLANVESAAITEYSTELTKAYGAMLENYKTTTTAATGEIRLTLGEDILSYAESALQQQGMQMELDWLSQITLAVDSNIQKSAMQAGLGIGLGDNSLLSADVILDLEKSMVYMAIPELNKTYLSADLSSQLPADQLDKVLSQSTQMTDALVKALPSEETLNKLITTYVDVVLSCIDNVEKQTDTITVNDVSQKVVVLTAKITQKDLLDICEKVLKKAEKDQDLKDVLTDLGEYVNEVGKMNGGEYFEPVDLYQEFVSAIPSALEEIEDAKEDTDSSNYVKLKVYVDMQNNVRGHAMTVYADGEKQEPSLSWLSVVKGDTTYTEADLAGGRITGEETVKKGVSQGEYTLYVEGEKLGTLEFEDVTENSGTLRLVPSEALISQALSGSGIPTAMLGDSLALELSYSAQDTQASYEVKILVGPKALIGLALSAKASDGGNITIPTGALNAADETAITQWLEAADLSKLITSLESAKVPTELVDVVKSFATMLQGN